jgi:hypothetical protein
MRNMEALKERFRQMHLHQERVVLSALYSAGGIFKGTTMQLRHLLSEPLGESTIKKAIKRLSDKYVVSIEGEKYSGKGKTYRVLQ